MDIRKAHISSALSKVRCFFSCNGKMIVFYTVALVIIIEALLTVFYD